eukprot:m.240025 g.240025  ORF g.240025 m.240025 type:complete len:450 (+) comp15299_c0_seq7:3125-4474(+)
MGSMCSSDKAVAVEQQQGNSPANKGSPASGAASSGQAPKPEPVTRHSSVDAALVKAVLMEDDEDFGAIVDALEDKSKQEQWWKDLDANGNGIVSLSEIHAFVKRNGWEVESDPLREAYKYTVQTQGDDDFVQRSEFPRLLRALVFMARLWDIFSSVDGSDDKRVDLAEFTKGFDKLGYPLTDACAAEAFDTIDKNDGGLILFPELCRYMAKVVSPMEIEFDDEPPKEDGEAQAAEAANEETTEADATEDKAPESTAEAEAEAEEEKELDQVDAALIQAMLNEGDDDFKEIVAKIDDKAQYESWWQTLDSNGNGIVSLSEIEKFVEAEGWKVASPPLRQAYKFTVQTQGEDEFVQKEEFSRLLNAMVFMNRLWDIFSEIDSSDDRRIDVAEFRSGMKKIGCNLSQSAAEQAFGEMDRNDGGLVLFGEFCRYIAKLYGSTNVAAGEGITSE